MKKHEALSVGEIIRRAIETTGRADEYERQQACYLWGEVVGPAVNRLTVRRWMDGTTLHLVVIGASLKHELSFNEAGLVQAINQAVGKAVVARIVIH